MKRFLSILLILVALMPCAHAEITKAYMMDFVTTYNKYADKYYNVPHLPFDGWTESEGIYTYEDDTISISIQEDFGRPFVISLCFSMPEGDFLAMCACVASTLYGYSEDNHAAVMSAYCGLRVTPEEHNHGKVGKINVTMKRDGDVYAFGVY